MIRLWTDEFEPKKIKFTCESCKRDFDSDASLLRHVSHKHACKDFYGQKKIWEMRRNGQLAAKRKWKQGHSSEDAIDYETNRYGTKSYVDKFKKSKKDEDGPKYSYVCEDVRNCEDNGKAFLKIFHLIYQEKKKEALKNLEQYARGKVYDDCVNFTLDKVFNEKETYAHEFDKQNPQIFEDYFCGEEDLIDKNLDKALLGAFENRIEKKIGQAVMEWIDSFSVKISKRCSKQTENYAFCNFFGTFHKGLFQNLQDQALEDAFSFTEEELNEIEEQFERLQELRAFRTSKLETNSSTISNKNGSVNDIATKLEDHLSKQFKLSFDALLVKFAKESELGKKIETKIEAKISKEVEYLKAIDDDSDSE